MTREAKIEKKKRKKKVARIKTIKSITMISEISSAASSKGKGKEIANGMSNATSLFHCIDMHA